MNMYIQVYRVLWCALYPFIYMFMLHRKRINKEDKDRFSERFGTPSCSRPTGKLYWIHAASVGEALSTITLIERLKTIVDAHFLLTTGTVSSAKLIISKGIPNIIHQYIPIDYKPFVDNFFQHWKPDCAIFVESELWPNLIDSCTAPQMFLVNARLSDESFVKWKIFRGLIQKLLRKFSLIMAQTQKDADYYRYFVDNVTYTGNLKYSTPPLPINQDLLSVLQGWKRKFVFVAASTHEGEDLAVINAYTDIEKRLGKDNVSLVIIPRHPDRSPRICDLIESKGYTVVLRSELPELSGTVKKASSDAICVDTFGEMGTFFKIATFCFVGGSLVRVGGHNIFEPVQAGCPTMFGPYMFNFTEMAEFLQEAEVAYRVKNVTDMVELFCRFVDERKFHEHILQKLRQLCSIDPARNIVDLIMKHIKK